MIRSYFFYLLFVLAFTFVNANKRDIYILVEDGPRPWTPHLLDALQYYQVPAVFIQNETSSIGSHQIRYAGYSIISYQDFLDKADPEKTKIIVVSVLTREIMAEMILWLAEIIPQLKAEGSKFLNWPPS